MRHPFVVALAALAVPAAAIAAAPAPSDAGRPAFEDAVLDAINAARADPRGLAVALRRYRATFEGRVVREDGDPIGVTTNEGTAAVDEAIGFLERQAPLPPLSRGGLLALAAHDHAARQGPAGGFGHISGPGAPGDRVKARGGDVFVAETIAYGPTTAAAVVRQLVVDDGIPGRGHRVLVFSPAYRFAGVGCGGHARYGYMCVIDYARTATGAPVLAFAAR